MVPTMTAKAIGGRFINLLRKNTPILMDINPAISGKVFFKCSGINRLREAPKMAPISSEPLQIKIPSGMIYSP